MPLSNHEKARIWDEEKERFKARMAFRLKAEAIRLGLGALLMIGMFGLIYWNFMRPESMIFRNMAPPLFSPKPVSPH